MKMCSSSVVPIHERDKFSLMQFPKNELEHKQVEEILYALVFGSLMYDHVCTRPNISFTISFTVKCLDGINSGLDN